MIGLRDQILCTAYPLWRTHRLNPGFELFVVYRDDKAQCSCITLVTVLIILLHSGTRTKY